MDTEKFAHHASDTVADHSAARFTGYGKAQPPRPRIIPVTHENHKLFRIMAAARIVALHKLRPPAQPMMLLES